MARSENFAAPTETTGDDLRPPDKPGCGMSLSMHADVDASCDCCSCEAEPYWLEAMAEKERSANRD